MHYQALGLIKGLRMGFNLGVCMLKWLDRLEPGGPISAFYSFVSRRVTVGTPPSLERPFRTEISRMKRYPISSPPSCLTRVPAAAAEPPVDAKLALCIKGRN